jgi:hypothetical protein
MTRAISLTVGLLSVVMMAQPVAAATEFGTPQRVSPAKLSEASLVVFDGQPHIAGVGPHGIWYFTRQNGAWSGERVTYFPGDGNSPRHGHPAIAIDSSDGSVTIVFERRVPEDLTGGPEVSGLRWTSNRSGNWPKFSEQVGDEDANSSGMMDPSIAVVDGHLFVAGEVGTVPAPEAPRRIRFITDVTGDWTSEGFEGSRSPSLVMDTNGNPQIAAQRLHSVGEDEIEWSVIYRRGTSQTGDFVHNRIVGHIDLIGSASLALSTTGKPRVAWSQSDGVHYAIKTSAGWSEELVAAGLMVTDLVIDSFGTAHMVASDGSSRLWYLTGPQNGGAGDFDALDVAAATPADDEIDVAADGRVQIAFQRDERLWWVRSQD